MSIERLLDVMQRLRDPKDGCEWDLAQDFSTIAPYTLEEAYEVVDAIQRSDLNDLKDELGDLLLQVVFHSQMASEQNAFDFDDVVTGIVDKMVRRHPHVFGDTVFKDTAEMKASWEATKAQERADKVGSSSESIASTLDGIAMALPALKRADKIQKRAARIGFDWPEAEPIFGKIEEETAEVREAVASNNRAAMEDELGDLLFSVVNLTRHYEIDAETALSRANEKFSSRFRAVEQLAREQDADMSAMTLAELDALWDLAKRG